MSDRYSSFEEMKNALHKKSVTDPKRAKEIEEKWRRTFEKLRQHIVVSSKKEQDGFWVTPKSDYRPHLALRGCRSENS